MQVLLYVINMKGHVGRPHFKLKHTSFLGFILHISKFVTFDLWQIVENEYPWLCSLTYNNNHICGENFIFFTNFTQTFANTHLNTGITLLSGPPHATILTGAAHCYSPGDSPSSYRVSSTRSSEMNIAPDINNHLRSLDLRSMIM